MLHYFNCSRCLIDQVSADGRDTVGLFHLFSKTHASVVLDVVFFPLAGIGDRGSGLLPSQLPESSTSPAI